MASMHPLQPLSSSEVGVAVKTLRNSGKISQSTRFVTVSLEEPEKAAVFENKTAELSRRRAFVVLFDNQSNSCFESVVELTPEVRIIDFQHIPDVQPLITPDEMVECERAVFESPEFAKVIKEQYGIDDLGDLICDIWSAGYYGDEGDGNRRLARPMCFFRDPHTHSPYAKPIEGIRPVVDLNEMKVIRVETHGTWPLAPPHFCAYETRHIPDIRRNIKPLEIVQSEGPSFTTNGNYVSWQNWSFVAGFNAREGLVLHDLRYFDSVTGRNRPIIYRASMSEMVVPYGDPAVQQARKNAFDIADYGIGYCANSLKLGCDCLGTIRYLDGHLCTSSGEPWTIENAICMHEEDYGVDWKHHDRHANLDEVRRSRRFVVSFFATVENYDYGFYWYLYQDGNIQLEVKLTGFLSVAAVRQEEGYPKYGRMIAPLVYGPNHQHYFIARLDFAVDGIRNTVSRVDVVAEELGPENPFRNGFYSKATPLRTELQARDHACLESARTWEISNAHSRNGLGEPTAYKFFPGDVTFPFAAKDAWWRKRAAFVDYHVWVTPYAPRELFAAGEYPNQHPGGDGLVKWTERNRKIDDTDCVFWYTFGITHVPRPEDYPVMPVVYTGFYLKPVGFFDRNPAWDLPPQRMVNKTTECRSHM